MIKIAEFITQFGGRPLNEGELIGSFQSMINHGLVQGEFEYTAQVLLDEGHCLPAGQQSPEEAQEIYLRRGQT